MKKKIFKSIALIIVLNLFIVELGFVGLNVKAEVNTEHEYYEEEFINEDGILTKFTYEIGDVVVVSHYENGILVSQSTANPKTDELISITEDEEIVSKISDVVVAMPVGEQTGEISLMGAGYFSVVSSKYSTSVPGCSSFLAQLFEKTSTSYDKVFALRLTPRQLWTGIVAAIIVAIFLKEKVTVTMIRKAIAGFGIGTTTTMILEGFEGTYQASKDVADYYVHAKNRTVFTNKITREYLLLRDARSHQKVTIKVGEQITAYGQPTSYSVMLNMGIVNVVNGGCK